MHFECPVYSAAPQKYELIIFRIMLDFQMKDIKY